MKEGNLMSDDDMVDSPLRVQFHRRRQIEVDCPVLIGYLSNNPRILLQHLRHRGPCTSCASSSLNVVHGIA